MAVYRVPQPKSSHEAEAKALAEPGDVYVPSVHICVSKKIAESLKVGKDASVEIRGTVTEISMRQEARNGKPYEHCDIFLKPKVIETDEGNEYTKMAKEDM